MTESPKLPPAPTVPRQPITPPKNLIGMGLLAVMPILAMVGVLDNHDADLTFHSGEAEVRLHYPDRLRFRTDAPLEISVLNESSRPQALQVGLDRAYLDAFTSVQADPSVTEVDETTVWVDLGQVPAHRTRRVMFELTASKSGYRSGRVRVKGARTSDERGFGTVLLP